MMSDAYPLWAALEEEAREELFVRCGGLFFGVRDDPQVRETGRALAATGLSYEALDPGRCGNVSPPSAWARTRSPCFSGKAAFARDPLRARERAPGARTRRDDPRRNARPGYLRARRAGDRPDRTGRGAPLRPGDRHGGPVDGRAAGAAETAAPGDAPADRVSAARKERGPVSAGPVAGLDRRDEQLLRLPGRRAHRRCQAGFPRPGEVVDPDAPPRAPDGGYVRDALAYAFRRLPDWATRSRTPRSACTRTRRTRISSWIACPIRPTSGW